MPPGRANDRPRRRRTRRLTLPGRKRRTVGDTQKADQDHAFQKMEIIYGFYVDIPGYTDPISGYTRYRKILFRRGDDVIFNSEDDDTVNVWVGQVDDIRASSDRTTVLAKVRWYYSRRDAAERIKNFRAVQCAPYERILSDEYDYASPYTFQAKIYVQEYDERDLDPPHIGPTDYFVRTTLKVRQKQFKPPLGVDTCICRETYNPYPDYDSTAPGMAMMHFCPSLECRKWYHASCLEISRSIDTSPVETRGLRLLATDPDKDLMSIDQIDIRCALELFHHSPSIVMHLPDSLLDIAQCPIVRYAGAPDGWAIGNVSDVVLARRFIYAAIESGGRPEYSVKFTSMVERYHTRMENKFWTDDTGDTIMVEVDEIDALKFLCQDLMEFGLLASVWEPYWEDRRQQFVQARELLNSPQCMQAGEPLNRPQFVCPSCRNAI